MIEFKIANMERRSSDGYVTTVHWTASKTVDGFVASSYGSLGLSDTESETFIPFEDLTEEIVIDWVKDKLGEETLAAMELAYDNNIAMQQNPPVVSGTPW